MLSITEKERKKLIDGLLVWFRLQRSFQEKHDFKFWELPIEKRREMFLRTLFAAISELGEAGDKVNKWWKKGCKDASALEKKREEILEEIIDAVHFILLAFLTLRVKPEEVVDSYLKKLGVNFRRQEDKGLGYV